MKISKLRKFAWVFFALALGTTTIFAQGRKNGNRVNNNQKGTCLEQISELTEEQKTQIQGMEKTHQVTMAELRDNRRNTVDAIEKNEIRGNMLKSVKSHQTAVKNLLSEEQQSQYALLHVRSNNSKNQQNNGFKNGNRNGAGQQQFARGNQSGVKQGNQKGNRQNVSGCQGNNKGKGNKGKGNNGKGRGNRSGNNSINS